MRSHFLLSEIRVVPIAAEVEVEVGLKSILDSGLFPRSVRLLQFVEGIEGVSALLRPPRPIN